MAQQASFQCSVYTEDGRWVVQWQTANMSGPAFWYYDSQEDACEAANKLSAENA